MILHTAHLHEIRNYLQGNGLITPEVLDDLQDHFCCMIEEKMQEGYSFAEGFAAARSILDPDEIREIQATTTYFLTIKSTIMLVKGIFITAFLSVFSYVLGSILYKLLGVVGDHGLAVMVQYLMQTLGLVIFGFGFLPLLFRFGYKRFVAGLQE